MPDDNSIWGLPDQPMRPGGEGQFSEQVKYQPVGARLPEEVAGGIHCTGAIVLEGPEEFILDFVQGVTRPLRLGVRIVMPPRVMGQFVQALRENLRRYEELFGPPKPMPKPNVPRRPTVQEIYNDMKIAERQHAGTYANAVMIAHTPADFMLDFITRFYPTAAVASRVYVSASQVPHVLETLNNAFQQHMRRVQPRPPEGGPDQPGQAPTGPSDAPPAPPEAPPGTPEAGY